jgi:hypothetical protein
MLLNIAVYYNIMNQPNDKNDDEKNMALEIKSLESEYETVLRQYEEAYNTYLTYIESESELDASFAQLKGRAFWGTAGVADDAADTAEACQDMCAAADACTGATFNTNKRYCWMRSGESAIVAGRDADVALIPKSRELLLQLTFYNKQLMAINQKLAEYYSTLPPFPADDSTADKHAMLLKYNAQLQSEQDMLLTEEQKLDTIHASRNTQDIVATQGYTQFRFWMLIACILLLVSMKMAMTVDENGNTGGMSIAVPVLILLLLAASFMLRSPQGFMIFGLIIFGLVAAKMLS